MPRIGGVNFWSPVFIQQRLEAQFAERNRTTVERDIAKGVPRIHNNVSFPVEPDPAIRAAPITPGFVRPEFDP